MQERNVGQRKQHITVMSQEGFSPLPTIHLTFTVKVGDLVKVPSCLLFVQMLASNTSCS